ncbi:MAG: TolC family protein [Desulfobacterales bacterium]
MLRPVIAAVLGAALLAAAPAAPAQPSDAPLTLREAVELALQANLALKRSAEEIFAAEAQRRVSLSRFLPSLAMSYSAAHRNRERVSVNPLTGREVVSLPEDQYTFTTSLTQPLFTGFGLIQEYRLAELGLDRAEVALKLARQDVILDAQNAFFQVLKTQQLVEVARQTVASIAAQREVAENFYRVGLTPLNDLLQSEVQLANAKQQLTSAQNDLDIARARFNTLLRRPVGAPVRLVEEMGFAQLDWRLEQCLEEAAKGRLELEIADLDVAIAERQVRLTEKDFYPAINLTGAYVRTGERWDVDGGEGIPDAAGWNVQATATWEFWQWGRTAYGRREKLARLSQSRLRKTEIEDSIRLEVQQAYLKAREAEQNIATVERAVEQARENLRITEEQYREQVATQTDVLVARTLLTQTETSYTNALYDFKIAKAFLFRAMGRNPFE